MVSGFVLEGDDQAVSFEIESPGWISCYLVRAQERIFLGSQTAELMISRLLLTVDNEATIVEELGQYHYLYQGHITRTAFVTSEDHHSLCVSVDGTAHILFWLDKNNCLVTTMKLSLSECKQWHQQLEVVRDELREASLWEL